MQSTEDIFAQITAAGQDHLIAHYNSITDQKLRAQFLSQLRSIDYPFINKLYNDVYKNKKQNESEHKYEPIDDILELEEIQKNKKELEEIGLNAIRNGQIGVLLMSGGQGTRLGFNHPKGMYKIGLQSGMSLFEFFTRRLQSLNNLAETKIPITWYIMTSDINDQEIRQYFEQNKYFGYNPEYIRFFAQGTLPALNFEGKIMIEKEGNISLAPGGNGALYYELNKQKILDEMKSKNIKYINVGAIDNILLKLGDPVSFGYMIKNNRDIVSKVIIKRNWEEKVGCHILDHGEPKVMQYSEMSEELKKETDATGKLKYRHCFIAIYLISVDFMYEITHNEASMAKFNSSYHIAHKKIPTYDPVTKQTIKPEKNTGIKFQLFCFDCFNLSKSFGIFEVDRNQEFAPVKNAEGEDSPETARLLISKQHFEWLKKAGVQIEGQVDAGEKLCEVDISLTYDGEGLEKHVGKEKEGVVGLPFYLRPAKPSL